MKNVFILAGAIFLCSACHSSSPQNNNTHAVDWSVKAAQETPETVDSLALIIANGRTPEIVAGEKIGHLILKKENDSIISQLKKPGFADGAMCHSVAKWFYGNNAQQEELDIYEACDEAANMRKTLQQIRIRGMMAKLPGGLTTSSSFYAIKTQFPGLSRSGSYHTDNGKNVILYDDVDRGIAFEFPADAEDSVEASTACYAVTIHQANKSATAAYLAFFSGRFKQGK